MEQFKRVRYRNCPLVEVVYQLSFPTILAIEAESPVKFQNEIRKLFPNYETQTEQEGELMINVEGENVRPRFRHRQGRQNHLFISEDGLWKVTLAKNMLSISTLDYRQWETMKEKFDIPLKAFIEVYDQQYFERVGLRYVDAINRKSLDLEKYSWNELISPHLLGTLALNDVVSVNTSSVQSEMVLDDNINIKIFAGLATVNRPNEEPENKSFVIDCDYYMIGKIMSTELESRTNVIHSLSTNFFRKSITEKLHEAMEPEEIKE